jgi:hypothetical protein
LDVQSATIAGGTVTLTLQVAGIDRIDVYVNGRPQSTSDVVGGPVDAAVKGGAGDGIRIEGFTAGVLVAVRRHQVR